MNRIDPKLFMDCFSSWVAACSPDKLDLVAIDGKTSRRTHNRRTGHRTRLNRIDGMFESAALETLAVQRRREIRREEGRVQEQLARHLAHYLDPATTFWSGLESKPLSMLSVIFQKKPGIKSGMPDVLLLERREAGVLVVFLELKSRRGVASESQKLIRAQLLSTGAHWWMARSARGACEGLRRSGVEFRHSWTTPHLALWEGPFTGAEKRGLPQHPQLAAERRAAHQRWRKRRRDREAAMLATQRSNASCTQQPEPEVADCPCGSK
jgi:hypothetical protein